MRSIVTAAFALAFLGHSQACLAKTFKCAATASFHEGRALVTLDASDQGVLTSGPTVDYFPLGVRDELQLTISYFWPGPKDLPKLDRPSWIDGKVEIDANKAHGHLVLTLGKQQFRFSEETIVAGAGEARADGAVEVTQFFRPNSALKDALAKGGIGRLEFVADNGEVLATQDLTIATASDLQDAVDKGYQAALGFAADAPNSLYCQ